MFRPIIIDPVALQITFVVAILLAISIWQKLRTAAGIVIAVYAIYMISFISANSKLKTSQPIRLASHQYSKERDKLDIALKLNHSEESELVNVDPQFKQIVLSPPSAVLVTASPSPAWSPHLIYSE